MRYTTMPDFADRGLFDAGLFIGALDMADARHPEAFPLVLAARSGQLAICTTTSILSEVYGALTWQGAKNPLTPAQAAYAVRSLIELPSQIKILPDSLAAALQSLEMASAHNLTARRIHDARHAAAALVAGVTRVYTYDVEDWKLFASEGLTIIGPVSSLTLLADN